MKYICNLFTGIIVFLTGKYTILCLKRASNIRGIRVVKPIHGNKNDFYKRSGIAKLIIKNDDGIRLLSKAIEDIVLSQLFVELATKQWEKFRKILQFIHYDFCNNSVVEHIHEKISGDNIHKITPSNATDRFFLGYMQQIISMKELFMLRIPSKAILIKDII